MELDVHQPSREHIQMEGPELTSLRKESGQKVCPQLGEETPESAVHTPPPSELLSSALAEEARSLSPVRCGVRTGREETWWSLSPGPVSSMQFETTLSFSDT